jgi:hypothetical protein
MKDASCAGGSVVLGEDPCVIDLALEASFSSLETPS